MATLTEAAYYSRRFIKYGAYALVLLIVLRIGIAVFTAWWNRVHPPPPPPATVAFGKLPALPFPEQQLKSLHFRLETATGSLPSFGPQADVYMIPAKRGNLLAFERAKTLAKKLGFILEAIQDQNNKALYRWMKDDPMPSTIEVDTVTGYFTFDVNWRVQPQLLAESLPPSETEAISMARSWLSGIGELGDDLAAGAARVTYLKVSGTDVVPALSQSEAQFARVDLFRSPLDKSRILPLDPNQGLVSVILFGSKLHQTQTFHAEYRYFPVDYTKKATYPLITSKEAWDLLQKGKGYFVAVPEGQNEIVVRRVSLDYFDPPQSGIFLQPIFVFEGDGGFVGYVPAVQEEWIAKAS